MSIDTRIQDGGRQTGSSIIAGYKTHKTENAKVSIGILGSGNPTKFILMSSDADERQIFKMAVALPPS
jgi:hypothetical protein